MIIVAKKCKPRRVAGLLILFVLFCGVLGAGWGLVQDIQKAEAVASLQVDPRGVASNAERVAYLSADGQLMMWDGNPCPRSDVVYCLCRYVA